MTRCLQIDNSIRMDMMTMQENNLRVQVDQYLKANLNTYIQKELQQTDLKSNINNEFDIRERIIRIEEHIIRLEERFKQVDKRFEDLLHYMDKRFEQVDKRFEQVDKRFEQIDKRFEQVDKRFEEMQKQMDKRFEDLLHQMDKRFEQVDKQLNTMKWAMGIGFSILGTGIFSILIAIFFK